MRIVIDMQGAQSTGSRTRGIGRYSSSIVKAILGQCSQHEVVLAVSGLFPETIPLLRADFDGLLPQSNIRVWQCLPQVSHHAAPNSTKRKVAELTYEAFLHSLKPDFILITSVFEGFIDDAVTSVHQFNQRTPIAVVLYDLIPLLNPSLYLDNPEIKSWYLEKVDHLRRADLWLAISESSRQEGITHLSLPEDRSINISTGADDSFKTTPISPECEQVIRSRYGLSKPFIMYTGGIDHRKNIDGLIRSYSRITTEIRKAHQLAIVCSVQDATRKILEELAAAQGLNKDEVIFTGFVPDEDLLALYNLCKLFVFPSWHEGFGLPALEAMRCGAPVIGSNTSSLPEVIGWQDALFDPHSEDAMALSMQRALVDDGFRDALREHGCQQATQFSWQKSAQRAVAAMEQYLKNKASWPDLTTPAVRRPSRPKLAYVSPLPPARSGIADYSAELLPELSEYYDIDVIVGQDEPLSAPWALAYGNVRTTQWLLDHASHYDRVLYQFGNSSYHQHMFDLLAAVPGVVVLHDFYLSGIQAHRELAGAAPNAWTQALLHDHGYHAVRERNSAIDASDVIWRYPTNLHVLQQALGIIVHSEHSRALARQWYGPKASADWAVIQLLRKPPKVTDRDAVRQTLGYAADDLLFCCFGILGKTKLNDRLLAAWEKSSLASNEKAHLVFVGQISEDAYGQTIRDAINNSTGADRIKITGWADVELFHQYLLAADVGVQLRTLTRGETSATVLDCMNNGVATIVNAHGSMADLDPDSVWMLPDEFADAELCEAMETLASQPARRKLMGERALEIIRTRHAPEQCAQRYHEAIEAAYQSNKALNHQLYEKLGSQGFSDTQLQSWAKCLAYNFPPSPRRRQLLVDVSEFEKRDAKSGIQRIVRAILSEWLSHPPHGYQVEPVYASTDTPGYRYARRFTYRFLGLPDANVVDRPVDAWPQDVFIGLDTQTDVVVAQQITLTQWKSQGCKVWFVVYDLLPISHPECFLSGAKADHTRWLETISKFDGALCISEAVAQELRNWQKDNNPDISPSFTVSRFCLGADGEATSPSKGLPEKYITTLQTIRSQPSFLMVGTIEPHKAHAQVLAAFEEYWKTGSNAQLVIVGKQGWMVEDFIKYLEIHPELGKRLFWLNGISDEYLEQIYSACTCLIAASYGEGFGLPLIEAAQHKLPILARDISVFREVAGSHATYFKAENSTVLAKAIESWLENYRVGTHVRSDQIPKLTWRESANQAFESIVAFEKRVN